MTRWSGAPECRELEDVDSGHSQNGSKDGPLLAKDGTCTSYGRTSGNDWRKNMSTLTTTWRSSPLATAILLPNSSSFAARTRTRAADVKTWKQRSMFSSAAPSIVTLARTRKQQWDPQRQEATHVNTQSAQRRTSMPHRSWYAT